MAGAHPSGFEACDDAYNPLVRIKICGITNLPDALAAVEAGADALGFVFAPSPRQVTPELAREIIRELPPYVTTVGLVVNQDPRPIVEASTVDVIQFHGDETPEQVSAADHRCYRAFRLRSKADLEALPSFSCSAYLLDAYVPGIPGGTGQRFPWALAEGAKRFGKPVIVAGGLTPENVAICIQTTRPYGVDVSSGVEAEPGRKDHDLVRRFIANARGAG